MSKTNPKHGKHARPANDVEQAADNALSADETQVLDPVGNDETQVLDPVADTDADDAVEMSAEDPTEVINPLYDGETQALPTIGANGDYVYAGEVGENAEMGDFPGFSAMSPKKKRNRKKIAAIVGGSIGGVIVVAYIVGLIVFTNLFFPNTKVGSIDASMKTSAEVAQQIDASIGSYSLKVKAANGFTFETSSTDAGLAVDSASVTQKMHEATPGWQWPYWLAKGLSSEIDLSDYAASTYDETGLAQSVAQAVLAFNETATAPTNATIAFNETSKQFVVQSEAVGTMLDNAEVTKEINRAILDLQPTLTLSDSALLQPTVFSIDARLTKAAETANAMTRANLTLMLAGEEAMVVDATVIAPFVTLSDSLEATLNEDSINELAESIADSMNTVGSERTYTRPDGKVCTVSGGEYGWEVDTDSLTETIATGIKNGATETIDVPCTQEAYAWTGAGEKDWGNRYIDIDLAEQHVYMYDSDGDLIWESDCISGIPDGEHDTSTGVYVLGPKKSPCKLTGYSGSTKIYETEVRYWMPFDGNAIGLHDADWQPDFGGTMYRDGYGSHGCVNLPVGLAYDLYQICEDGDVVVSHW